MIRPSIVIICTLAIFYLKISYDEGECWHPLHMIRNVRSSDASVRSNKGKIYQLSTTIVLWLQSSNRTSATRNLEKKNTWIFLSQHYFDCRTEIYWPIHNILLRFLFLCYRMFFLKVLMNVDDKWTDSVKFHCPDSSETSLKSKKIQTRSFDEICSSVESTV